MKTTFSFLIFISGLGLAKVAHADWQTIVTCENGKVVVDVDTNERRKLQLVVYGAELLTKLKNAGMASPKFGDQEYVYSGAHAELRRQTPIYTAPESLGGVFYPWDFKKMITRYDGSSMVYEVENRGGALALKSFVEYSGTHCDGEFEGECVNPVEHRNYVFQREFDFTGCHY